MADTKEYTHCYHNYPAMMIPQIARKLISDFAPSSDIELLFDPYMGSGTTLVEAAVNGINSIGFDLNPLARFVAKSKVTLYDLDEIDRAFAELKSKIDLYFDGCLAFSGSDFAHITKPDYWYSRDNLLRLKYLSEIIDDLSNNDIKSFFRVALSEVIREVSYTRKGEFKRYRIEEKRIPHYNPQPFALFVDKVERNRVGLSRFEARNNTFCSMVYNCNSVTGIPEDILRRESVDMVITSPPYGDSRTTVAYGQFSRWASEWFKFDNAMNIDRILMGGVPNKGVELISKSISKELMQIKEKDISRYIEVLTFLDEYKRSMQTVASTVKVGGRVCYVVGNRNVKGVQIPLDYFTAEVFEDCGFRHDVTIVRSIPNKRMPSKTSPTNKKGINVATMTSEYIVVLTKI